MTPLSKFAPLHPRELAEFAEERFEFGEGRRGGFTRKDREETGGRRLQAAAHLSEGVGTVGWIWSF